MIKILQCALCKHLEGRRPEGGYHCAAFPDRIPEDIIRGRHDHHQPYPGDHGIRFEAKGAQKATA